MIVLIPSFLLIFLGAVLQRGKVFSQEFWSETERATYYVFFPALLTTSLATANFRDYPSLPLAGAVITGVICVACLSLLLQRVGAMDGPAFSSVFQGAMRPNSYIGVATAMALAGGEGVTLCAIAMMVTIPLVNLLCVPVVAHFGSRDSSLASTVWEIAKNPLILSCALGVGINVGGVPLPQPVFEAVNQLGKASMPLGLLTVGAGLRFSGLHAKITPLLLSSLLKLFLLPLFTALACLLYQAPPLPTLIAVQYAALPASASSYILARQLGGDEALMAAIITTQTILAALTLPFIASIFA
jgi:predicted permease